MLKNYNTYIKENNEEELTPLLKIALKLNKPFDEIIKLHCSYNKLTSLDGIEKLINLKELYCDNNKLDSLDGIEKLINIEKLYCFNNQLNSLHEIKNLVNLKRLDCSNNKLTNLDDIENLPNLKYIYCGVNNFSDSYKKYLKDYYDTLNLMIPNHENKIKLII